MKDFAVVLVLVGCSPASTTQATPAVGGVVR
jgi:hypothetical protein